MLHFDRIDVFEGIYGSKTSVSRECIIYDCPYFLDKGLTFQPDVCNGNEWHDVLMMPMDLNDTATLNTHGVNYCGIINGINKIEAVNLLQNVDLSGKSGTKYNLYLSYIKSR